MKWYPWLTAPYKDLVAQYASGRGHHALLLHLPEQYGEGLLVNAIGRRLLCLHPNGEKTCGQCHSCQLMNAGTHPDWYEIVPENNKAALGVEQIRKLTDKVYERSQQGGAKVIWFPDVSLLTDAAANALLKTLEEPPEKTYFLLGCRELGKLLPTIRSRCLYWRLPLPNESYCCEWLARQHPQSARQTLLTALRLADGSPLKASQLLAPDYWRQRESLMDALFSAIDQNDLLSLLPELSQDNAPECLNWCVYLFLDVAKRQHNISDHIVNQDRLALIQRLAEVCDGLSLQKTIQEWLVCRHQLLTINGVNRELLLTNLLIKTEQACLT